ncbi:hypothetical protein O9992_00760 [Vibrio lentus]|nr:hypothetical protein [Vibrio lentus]
MVDDMATPPNKPYLMKQKGCGSARLIPYRRRFSIEDEALTASDVSL